MIELTLAEKIRRLRGTESQAHAAKRIGIRQGSLSGIERSHRQGTNFATLKKIADAYGVLVEYLEGDLRTYMKAWAERVLVRENTTSPGKRLGRLLAELETRYGITSQQVASALHISEANLGLYLADRAAPRPFFEKLEELTGVPTEMLLFGPLLPPAVAALYSGPVSVAIRKGISPERLVRILEEME